MATPDSDIRKIIINQADLPYVSNNGIYYLRYRVVSENKTDTTAWSQIYAVSPNSITSILAGVSQSVIPTYRSDGTTVNITWNIPANLVADNFDIFVNWSTASDFSTSTGWLYSATTISNNYQMSIPVSYVSTIGSTKYVKFWIQQASRSTTIKPVPITSARLFNPDSYVFQTGPTAIDGGSPTTPNMV